MVVVVVSEIVDTAVREHSLRRRHLSKVPKEGGSPVDIWGKASG